MPDFLKGAASKCGAFEEGGTIPSCDEADAFFGHVGDDPFDGDMKSGELGGSMHSIAFSETSSCSSLFRDNINKENQSTPVRIPSERYYSIQLIQNFTPCKPLGGQEVFNTRMEVTIRFKNLVLWPRALQAKILYIFYESEFGAL